MKHRYLKSVMALALISVVGCATYKYEEKAFLPGSDAAVMAAKTSMTESKAVTLLEKYIREYVDRQNSSSQPSTPFAAALQGLGNKLSVTSTGFTYSVTSTYQIGNRVTVNMARKEVKFADATKVVTTYSGRGTPLKPDAVVLYDKKDKVLLRCPVNGSEELIPRVLAAIEVLCPNIGKAEPIPASAEKAK